jgi:hypothetical protein
VIVEWEGDSVAGLKSGDRGSQVTRLVRDKTLVPFLLFSHITHTTIYILFTHPIT